MQRRLNPRELREWYTAIDASILIARERERRAYAKPVKNGANFFQRQVVTGLMRKLGCLSAYEARRAL